MGSCDVCGGCDLHYPDCKMMNRAAAVTPTPPTAAAPKSARETIKAHLEALTEWSAKGWDDMTLERMASPYENLFTDEVVRIARSALALRALLDAPEGAVGMLCEAAEDMVVVSGEDSLQAKLDESAQPREGTNAAARVEVYRTARTLKSALTALRASPESVEPRTPEARGAVEAVIRERDDRERARKATQEELDKVSRESRHNAATAVRAQTEWRRALTEGGVRIDTTATEIVALTTATKALVAKRDALRKHLEGAYAALSSETRPGDAMQGATVGEMIANLKAERDSLKADLSALKGSDHIPDAGKKVTPPPATEAPISERARLVYEGATRMWARTTWGGSDEDVSARVTAFAAAFLAAAERAAKGNAPAEGEK